MRTQDSNRWNGMQIVTKEKKATDKHADGKIQTCMATKGCTQWGGTTCVCLCVHAATGTWLQHSEYRTLLHGTRAEGRGLLGVLYENFNSSHFVVFLMPTSVYYVLTKRQKIIINTLVLATDFIIRLCNYSEFRNEQFLPQVWWSILLQFKLCKAHTAVSKFITFMILCKHYGIP